MKLRKKTVLSFVAMLTLVVGLVMGPLVKEAEAGVLTSTYLYFSRIEGGLTSGVTWSLRFAPSQAISSGGTVRISFSSGSWCTNGTDLVVTGVTSSALDASMTALPNSGSALTGTCASNVLTIANVGALTGTTDYGVTIADGTTGKIGTAAAGEYNATITAANGQTQDTLTFAVRTVSDGDVVVSADVETAGSVTCTISANTVDLGVLYQGGAYQHDDVTIGTVNSGTSGYYWTAFGTGSGAAAGLYSPSGSPDLIPSSSSTVNMATVDADGVFGIRLDDVAEGEGTVATDFGNGTYTTFGGIQYGFSGAKLLVSYTGDTTMSGTLSFGARAGTGTKAATDYSETVTFSCGAYY